MPVSRLACVLASALALLFAQASLAQQQSCGSPSTLEAIKKIMVSKATTNVAYWLELKINTPQYRMKDVIFEFESFRQTGNSYAGLECQGIVKMLSPPDVTNANGARGVIKFVLQPDGKVDFY